MDGLFLMVILDKFHFTSFNIIYGTADSHIAIIDHGAYDGTFFEDQPGAYATITAAQYGGKWKLFFRGLIHQLQVIAIYAKIVDEAVVSFAQKVQCFLGRH
jgi:hypothetical protein